mgnify:CR=1 FL=1
MDIDNNNEFNYENKIDVGIDLIEKIHNHEMHWTWIKGHNENILNEKADMLAKKAIES